MEQRRRTLYRERTGWAWWLHVLVLGSTLGALVAPALLGDGPPIGSLAWSGTTGTVLLVVGLIYLLLGGLTVVLEPERLRVGLGRGWPIGTTIPLSDIETLESVEYRPLRDFGGWGLRGSRDRRIWSARGNKAVRLSLRDGRVVYIGSDEPRTLENRIRGVMGVAP